MNPFRTLVIFRRWRTKGGGIIALFPYEPGDPTGLLCRSFKHVGQHGAASPGLVTDHTRPATPGEYASLKRELESVPYDYRLTVIRRMPPGAADVRRLILNRDGSSGIQAINSAQTERLLRRAGLCDYQTGYGLPWLTYCGRPLPCPDHSQNGN